MRGRGRGGRGGGRGRGRGNIICSEFLHSALKISILVSSRNSVPHYVLAFLCAIVKVDEQTLSKKSYQELLNSHQAFTDVLFLNYMNIGQTCNNNTIILKERS